MIVVESRHSLKSQARVNGLLAGTVQKFCVIFPSTYVLLVWLLSIHCQ